MSLSINIQNLRTLSSTVPVISTKLNINDYLGAIKVRWGIGRNHYTVNQVYIK